MKVVKYEEVEWTRNHGARGGTPTGKPGSQKGSSLHRRLQRGNAGEPGNFEFIVLWTQQSDEGSTRHFPRHRHTFDQVRLTLTGDPEWIPGVPTRPGEISYIPAGTWYGPYDRQAGDSQLHVQFEGANRYPFADYKTVTEARDRLAERGTFERGRYWWTAENGEKKSKDGFEAVQEEANGHRPTFPEPRFTTPLNISPDAFTWLESGQPGVETKELGHFTERETRLAMLRLEAGAKYQLPAARQTTCLFVTSGSGSADGESIGERDSMKLLTGETGTLSTESGLELFLLGLPKQDNDPVGDA